jgi:hypothetical protein
MYPLHNSVYTPSLYYTPLQCSIYYIITPIDPVYFSSISQNEHVGSTSDAWSGDIDTHAML